MITDAYEHVRYQLFNNPLRKYPFEHIYVSHLFPQEYYQQILSHLPNTEQYKQIDQLGKVGPGSYQERLLFPLQEKAIATLIKEKSHFWQNFMNMFVNSSYLRLY